MDFGITLELHQGGAAAGAIEHEADRTVGRRVAARTGGDGDETLRGGVGLLLLSLGDTGDGKSQRGGDNRSAPPVNALPDSLAHAGRQERFEGGSILAVLQAPGATVAAKPH
ncbi:hypothetical protein ATE48_05395 [Candidatus Viadribacter manganicus]|uniref:Uncharacterized protein n=1 Tax=Candidatus Viadribacter manganicus TaxID=1759059 RepID=A0A1B1AFP7_9PROT|nr:hypothetical protein ATE48_05395 [Candidatus Viadribacter manganicus]